VRNNLQGLLGLVHAMRDRAPNVRAFADAMEAQLSAMCHVHQLLAQRQWTPIDVRTLVDGSLATLRHLAPYPTATQVDGPVAFLDPHRVLPLTAVLVEWFTNSCKYGSHSVPGGRLNIRWDIVSDNDLQLLRLSWTERGGPPICGTIAPGLGTELVQSYARRELAGRCELRYPTAGAELTIEFPMRADVRAGDVNL
jgi:two-component sensor histidine kinase